MTEYERMINDLLNRTSAEKEEKMFMCDVLVNEYNTLTSFSDMERVCKKLIPNQGNDCYVRVPFYCDYGCNIKLGKGVYINRNCTFLDESFITIGNNVMIGPNVGLYTASHPITAEERNAKYYISKSITIEDDVWVGGGTTILGGVTIGARTVIGAGSVVTRNIPSDVVAIGNPCRIYRKIDSKDKAYWQDLVNKYHEDMGTKKGGI